MNGGKRAETGDAARITQQKINKLCFYEKTRNFASDKKTAENFGEASDLKSGLFFWKNTRQKRAGKAVYVLTKNRKK